MYPEKGPRGRLVCFCVVCPLVYPEKGPRGRLVCFCVVCPLVYPRKGPRGRLACFCVVCPLVYPEKGPRGRLVGVVCLWCSEKSTQWGAISAIKYILFFHPCSPCLDSIISYSLNSLGSIFSFLYTYIQLSCINITNHKCTMISFFFVQHYLCCRLMSLAGLLS